MQFESSRPDHHVAEAAVALCAERLALYSLLSLGKVLARTKASPQRARTSNPLVHGPGSCSWAVMRGMCSKRKNRRVAAPRSVAAMRVFFPRKIAEPATARKMPVRYVHIGRPGNQGGP